MKYNLTSKDLSQIERFAKGFPWLKIVAPATPGHGVEVLSDSQVGQCINYSRSAAVSGRVKFVPASGAASRMFKDLFAGLAAVRDGKSIDGTPAAKFVSSIGKFAFYSEELFPEGASDEKVLSATLETPGLGYGSKPKGVLAFHKYSDGEIRTAFAEHLVEAQKYMRDSDGTASLVVTVSPEHLELFKEAFEQVRPSFEERYGVRYNVEFVFQDKSTDTIAVDPEGKPFLKEDGTPLFRPAGHGALIYNLNALEQELVSIKNIDNVSCERYLDTTAKYKEALMGRALQLRDTIFGYLEELDKYESMKTYEPYPAIPGYNNMLYDPYSTPECQELCRDIEDFLARDLCVTMPIARSCSERVASLRGKLNRPIRVCGVVRNQGEPGGGPFIIEGGDGTTSLQILEGAQIKDASSLEGATHFNPVDLVCCLRDYHGNKFDLTRYVDEETGFISSKSYQGRELRALELPGLWNGAMSDWNTLFVEVPLETFNPVKTVLDLLRPAHQA
ncbi:MAG: DUF4301 family protein [Bacteroidales bacterium]|nr:DUF4301 family protein [Bacteroidales bacterium]